MTTGDLIVGGVIALMVIGAILVLIRNRKQGRNSCGCKCSGCCGNRTPNVTIDEETCDGKKN